MTNKIDPRVAKQANRVSKILLELKELKGRQAILEAERDSIYAEWADSRVPSVNTKFFSFAKKEDGSRRFVKDPRGLFEAIKKDHGDLVYNLIGFTFESLDKYIPPDTLSEYVDKKTSPTKSYVAKAAGQDDAGE